MSPILKAQIVKMLEDTVKNTVERIKKEDSHRPFHVALLSEEVLAGSRFERSFSTSFGQGAIEKISLAAALANGASDGKSQKKTTVNISVQQLHAIDQHLADIRNKDSGSRGSWDIDIKNIINVFDSSNQKVKRDIISDLWWVKDGINNYVSIKTVKPNIDQTVEAKKNMLMLKINDMTCNVYFGLYYNPYGKNRADYNWSPPKKIFDFLTDPCILIGKDYWDTIGGAGFYDDLLSVFNEVGQIIKN